MQSSRYFDTTNHPVQHDGAERPSSTAGATNCWEHETPSFTVSSNFITCCMYYSCCVCGYLYTWKHGNMYAAAALLLSRQ
jgi:hypothetical protein